MSAIPEPAQRLAPQARWAWRATWFLGCCAALVAIAMARDALPSPWAGIALAVVLVALVVGTPLVPELRWRRWRWEVREQEIDLQRGILVVRRTLIPMARVQHVETERGVIGQALGLSTVEIHTAAGSHEIPLLRDGDAGAIRSRIAELARTDAGEVTRPDPGELARPDAGELARPDPGEVAGPARGDDDG